MRKTRAKDARWRVSVLAAVRDQTNLKSEIRRGTNARDTQEPGGLRKEREDWKARWRSSLGRNIRTRQTSRKVDKQRL